MSSTNRERFGRRCDALVHGGIMLLLVFAPLAFGSVHAWAQMVFELLIAALVIVWGIKLLGRGTTTEANERLRRWALPLLAFGVLALLQVVPLPPIVLGVLSPNTYALYRDTLPGWPGAPPYSALPQLVQVLRDSATQPPPVGALPSVAETPDQWASANVELIGQVSALTQRLSAPGRWRPLAIYSYRDFEELLRMLAYCALFFCSLRTLGNLRHSLMPKS